MLLQNIVKYESYYGFVKIKIKLLTQMELGFITTILILVIVLIAVIKRNKKVKSKLNFEIEKKDIEISTRIEENNKLISNLEKYSGIESIQNEIDLENKKLKKIQFKANRLNDKYLKSKKIFKELEKDIKLYQNDLEFIELGIYKPIFDYDTSEKYKEELSQIIDKQKKLIKEGNACICQTNWHVGNSRKQGEIMTRRNINLALRAFNGECDKLIAKVKWNNVKRFEERIKKSHKAINRLNKTNDVHITQQYLQSKVNELHLAYEFEHKKHEEKEERKAIRAEQREEEKAQREFEKARKEAELEEIRYQKALERAQKELGLVSGEEVDKLNNQIADLQKNLKEAHDAKERAISRAQETKSGHIYIISNIGSFGENIYKIGMTRRLEPMDRVKELGVASVPFKFDLHALIFTENAPELESLLHKEFDDRRINKVNNRKEYFRVTLNEIENVIKDKYKKEVEFIKIPEAQEFRETRSIIKQLEKDKEQIKTKIEKYPDSLF